MCEMSLVSVILPCFNESGNILPLIDAIHKELSFYPHQIVVVDDNSPDGTYELVKKCHYDFVKPILRTIDPSLAKSIRAGIEESDGSILIVMDSDFNHQPIYLSQMVHNLEYYDCVIASRFVYGGMMEQRWRHLFSWIFNIFVRILTGGKITDNLYGFFSIKKELLSKVDFDKVFWGYGDYCIRLMFYLQKEKNNMLQIPAVNGKRLKGDGNSKFLKVFWQYFKETYKLVFKERF